MNLFQSPIFPIFRPAQLAVFLLSMVLTFIGATVCFAQQKPAHNKAGLDFHLDRVKKEMKPLNLSQPQVLSSPAQKYLQYYGIYFDDIPQYLGTFQSGKYVLSAHIFHPPKAAATVFLLHGYCDHTGMLKNLIGLLVNQGLAVAVYDLPGHGLSGGEACMIDDFNTYVEIFSDFIDLCVPYLPQPYHFAGHSTGCAIALDFMHRVSSDRFDKVIFIAPLVRSAYWTLSKAHHYLTKPFMDTVPRVFFDNTSDPEFNRFIENDPLQCQAIPLKWIEALFAWNERVEKLAPISHPVLILQGSEDTVVDWEFNIVFLKQKNNLAKVKWFQNGRHNLLNETEVIRQEVLKAIADYFQAGDDSTIRRNEQSPGGP
ncbi:MAG: alpha/beta hydrolase [Deltaproteobacteria bacterium]|nr:alpha/beta hydrolase [Deltaproteobacteria bacterium]